MPARACWRCRASAGCIVLVVEDNQINQVVIVSMLRAAGHECDIAKDGSEAIAAVQQRDYDGVLMDIQMPVMDGVEATNAIRALGGKYMQLPIIALTANAMAGDEERYLGLGMNDYVAEADRSRPPDLGPAPLRRHRRRADPPRRPCRWDRNRCNAEDDEDLKRLLGSL